MNLRLTLPGFFCVLTFLANAGKDPKYPVNAIPEELKKDVNSVVREDVMVYTIESRSEATMHAVFAVTILDEKGNHFATRLVGYDKLTKIRNFTGTVYDANGQVIRKLKTGDAHDQSSFDGFTLYSDNRLKWMDLAQNTFPYTVEFDYEVSYKFLYFIEGSAILSRENVSVQHASYELIYPVALKPHVKALNIKEPPIISRTKEGAESMKWNFEKVMPIKFEPYGPDPSTLIPKIIAAPSEFEYSGYVGNMSSWEEYGKWNLLLNEGRDQLPEATRQKVRELTKGMTTKEEKARALYEYLQNKTRYVGIQLGIGGLQPFEASVVDQNAYGDCKALSNYMVALLKEAGVKAYYSTVWGGDNGPSVLVDFPSHQANHVIVAIPNGADTLWLECTSQTNPFGYQGKFTGDRKALMITEQGGKLVNTTRYSASQSKQIRSADVVIEKNGNGKAKIMTTFSGLQYEDDNLDAIVNMQHDDQKKWVQKNTDIPSFDINSFSMINKKDRIPSAVVNEELTLNRLASVSGKRLFLTPNLMNRSRFVPEKSENRRTNVVLRYGYTDIDTIRYHIPQELYPEFLPPPVRLKSKFGEYEASFTLDQGKVVYVRKMIRNRGEYAPETYNELVEFYKNISKADNVKIVFLNKT